MESDVKKGEWGETFRKILVGGTGGVSSITGFVMSAGGGRGKKEREYI